MLLLSAKDVCAALSVKCLFMRPAQVLSGDASTMKTEDDCVRPHICEFDGTTFAETSQSGRGLPDRPRAKTDDKTRDTTKCRRKLVSLPSKMLLTLLKRPELSRNPFKSTFSRKARDRLRDRAIRLRSRDSETRSIHFSYSGRCNIKWMKQLSDRITLTTFTKVINANELWRNSETFWSRDMSTVLQKGMKITLPRGQVQ